MLLKCPTTILEGVLGPEHLPSICKADRDDPLRNHGLQTTEGEAFNLLRS
jgi:hypothetical protein